MIAVGCFIPFVIMLLGAAIGAALGGDRGGLFGLVGGFLVGAALMAVAYWVFERARNRG